MKVGCVFLEHPVYHYDVSIHHVLTSISFTSLYILMMSSLNSDSYDLSKTK